MAVAQVLLGCDAEHRWLRLAPARIGHLFPRLPCQSEDNRHLRGAAPLLLAAAAWLVRRTPSWQERVQAVHLLHVQPSGPGPCPIVCAKGFAGAGVQKAAADLGHVLIRPPRADEPDPPVAVFPGWLRQRVEAVIWTLENRLGM